MVTLLNGDINQDGKLDLLDYNILINCYSDLLPAKACGDSQTMSAADLNDDGKVKGEDYNIFLRSLAAQSQITQ